MKKKKLGLLTRLLIGITAGMLIGSAGDIYWRRGYVYL